MSNPTRRYFMTLSLTVIAVCFAAAAEKNVGVDAIGGAGECN